jgi:hypothetical protein
MVIDPLGLRRCARCQNVFAYDADERATELLRTRGVLGARDFICTACVRALEHRYGSLEELFVKARG